MDEAGHLSWDKVLRVTTKLGAAGLEGESDVKFKGLVSIAAALSLVTISSAAVAQQAAPQPAVERVQGESEAKGSTVIVSLLALTAVIGGLVIALKNKGTPTSP